MKLTVEGRTSLGRGRVENEDTFVVDPSSGFYGVCDGVNSAPAGEIAAMVALESAHRTVRYRPWVPERIAQGDASISTAMDLLDQAIDIANAEVRSLAREHSPYEGMACTATLLLIVEDQAALASVGDSRFYLSHQGATRQLTIDHTPEEESRRLHPDSPDRAAASRYVRRLARTLGTQESVLADVFPLSFQAGDRFLICTDGLSDHIDNNEEIEARLQDGTVGQVADGFIELLTAEGARDNATVIVGAVD